ncbi:aldo/keto reductase [Micromonospora sp. AMSO12t]|uniref:aldo/keto reductase n=1 Tax=Micromonospora sp. AMSO12t TaxID=2650410 RepID=UPI00124B7DCB|nr:aldo/keto reductase [Micromonospora sp. AMSO12t]KAB1161269.1 aldo/keto reductase [Micromonospora sp. AMSO12t]
MQLRPLGGLAVSGYGLGTWTWGHETDEDSAREQLWCFLDAGGTLVDTAAVYTDGNAERILGRLLASVPRDAVVVSTKAGVTANGVDTTPDALLAQLDASLRRLGTDHVDLWQLHAWSDATPLPASVEALRVARDSGRARAVGVCNYTPRQVDEAFAVAERIGMPISGVQLQYSLLVRAAEAVAERVRAHGAGVLAWSPLASGVLTGKYHRGVPPGTRGADPRYSPFIAPFLSAPEVPAALEVLDLVAGALGRSCAEVALAWVRDRPGVAGVLLGARDADQVRAQLASVDLELPAEVADLLTSSVMPIG